MKQIQWRCSVFSKKFVCFSDVHWHYHYRHLGGNSDLNPLRQPDSKASKSRLVVNLQKPQFQLFQVQKGSPLIAGHPWWNVSDLFLSQGPTTPQPSGAVIALPLRPKERKWALTKDPNLGGKSAWIGIFGYLCI
jgi:hypothetical protein